MVRLDCRDLRADVRCVPRESHGALPRVSRGLYIFVGWLLAHWALGIWLKLLFDDKGHGLSSIVELFLLGVWVWMLIKTSNNERYELPLVGELAEKSL